jgi:ABC-type uncharacterized transport system fused permease/ATPase subunit
MACGGGCQRRWRRAMAQAAAVWPGWCWCCCRSVWFNFLGRDFFSALSERDADAFVAQLYKYLAGFAVGIPVFVVTDYLQVQQHGAWWLYVHGAWCMVHGRCMYVPLRGGSAFDACA